MNDNERLKYLGFNLEYPRDRAIIEYFENIDKGARSFVARRMLEFCITQFGPSALVPTLMGMDMSKTTVSPSVSTQEKEVSPSSQKSRTNTKNSSKPADENTNRVITSESETTLPEEFNNLIGMFS